MPSKKQKDPEPEEIVVEEITITIGKEELSAINLLRKENETALEVIRRALQDSLEYGVMKHVLSSIDGRINELSNRYKTTKSSIINFRYDVNEGIKSPEELRKTEDKSKKTANLKLSLERKWAEMEGTNSKEE